MRARALRVQQTDAEARLWHHLRNRQFLGLKFRRQHPIGAYFADFACLEIGLIIELDGSQHQSAEAYDAHRAAVMQDHGFRTVRFWTHHVLTQTESVLTALWQLAQPRTHTP